MNKFFIIILILFSSLQGWITISNRIGNIITAKIFVKKICGNKILETFSLSPYKEIKFNINHHLNICRPGLIIFEIEDFSISYNLYKNWDYDFYILADGVYVCESSNSTDLEDILNSPPFKIFSFN